MKLADQVYDAPKAQIHDFELVAGDRFFEANLGQRLGMSRTPGLEALKSVWLVPPAERLTDARADRIEATYIEHAKVLRAVSQKKADQAQLLLKTHIEQSKAEVRKITLHTLHAAHERGGR